MKHNKSFQSTDQCVIYVNASAEFKRSYNALRYYKKINNSV